MGAILIKSKIYDIGEKPGRTGNWKLISQAGKTKHLIATVDEKSNHVPSKNGKELENSSVCELLLTTDFAKIFKKGREREREINSETGWLTR